MVGVIFSVAHTTFHLVLALSASLRPKYGTPYLFTSANPKHTLLSDVILRRTTFFHPILPLAAPVIRPDSLPRLWRYINLLLTYLLSPQKMKTVCVNGIIGLLQPWNPCDLTIASRLLNTV